MDKPAAAEPCPHCSSSGLLLLTLPKWRKEGAPVTTGTRLALCGCPHTDRVRWMADPVEDGGHGLHMARALLQAWAERTIWQHYDVLDRNRASLHSYRVVKAQLRLAQHIGVRVPDTAWPNVGPLDQSEIRDARELIKGVA